MKTAIVVVAGVVIWIALAVAAERLLPPNEKRWARMEEMANDGAQTSLRLLGLGAVSVVAVIALALAFELF